MAGVTRDDLKMELASFGETTLRVALEDFRSNLLSELNFSYQTSALRRQDTNLNAANLMIRSSLMSRGLNSDIQISEDEEARESRNFRPRKSEKCKTRLFMHSDVKATFGAPTAEEARQSSLMGNGYRGQNHNAAIADNDDTKKLIKPTNVEANGSYTLLDPSLINGTKNIQERGCACMTKLVGSRMFESAVGVTVVLNSLTIGLETELEAKGQNELVRDIAGPFFCACFTLEFVLRLIADGCFTYFTSDKWAWNVFDFVMVLLQIMDELQHYLVTNFEYFQHLSFLRSFRLVRLIRIARLFRVVHLFEDLRLVATSIVQSLGALLWAFAILIMVLYMYSVLCMQAVLYSQREGPTRHHVNLNYWFGSLPRTMLTMFECIIGGVSWDEVVSPLISDVSPFMGLFHCCYLSLSLYAITNMLTGVFVERATTQAREDKDQAMAKRMRNVFFPDGIVELYPEGVTWERFESMLDHTTMKEFFTTINVDVAEAKSIFHLLDQDGGGNLDARELVQGCLRLRGSARALEVAMLMQQCTKLQETVDFLVAMQTVGGSLPADCSGSVVSGPEVDRSSLSRWR